MRIPSFVFYILDKIDKWRTRNEPLVYTWEVKDPRGRTTYKRTRKSRSYVAAWNVYICAYWTNNGGTTPDTTNAARNLGNGWLAPWLGPVNTSTYGTRIGINTGATPVAIGNYALDTPIIHGVAAGNMSHGAETYTVPVTVGSTRSFTVQRTFVNNSGNTIIVAESGIYVKDSVSAWYFLIQRDVPGSPVSVLNLGSITVTTTVKVTV